MTDLKERDLEIRREVYDRLRRGEAMPSIASLASACRVGPGDVEESLGRLADAHMLVLQRNGEILMANPFSAVPTPFLVTIGDKSWYGNCIWDAMGIAAVMKADAHIDASCGCCGTEMRLRVPQDCIADERRAHFAIPAARWWDDVVFN